MVTITKINETNLILQRQNETVFINPNENEGFKLKQLFLTTDGYEAALDLEFSKDELYAAAETLNKMIYDIEHFDFVAIGDSLFSDIHFKAKNFEEAQAIAHDSFGWDVTVYTYEDFKKLPKTGDAPKDDEGVFPETTNYGHTCE